jgi:hypothetical protein
VTKKQTAVTAVKMAAADDASAANTIICPTVTVDALLEE